MLTMLFQLKFRSVTTTEKAGSLTADITFDAGPEEVKWWTDVSDVRKQSVHPG